MNYFILSQDRRIIDPIELVSISSVVPLGPLTEEIIQRLQESHLQFEMKDKEKPVLIDYIERPIPLLSDRLKPLVEKFAPYAKYCPVALVNLKRMRQEGYWFVIPPLVNCLSEQTEFHPDGTLKRLVLDQTKIGQHYLFRIAGLREMIIVTHLGLAESILRRDFEGVSIRKAEQAIG
ncbi:MAG: serine protease [Candidatus Pristimantibacillus sp.]